MTSRGFMLCLLAATLLCACGDDGPIAAPSGPNYSVTIAGAFAAQQEGRAWFGADTADDGAPIFGVLLGDSASRHVIMLVRPGSDRPAPGTYPVEAANGAAAADWRSVHMVAQSDESASFLGISGSVTITESSAVRLKGSFQYVAHGFLAHDPEHPVEITVSGTFDAAPTAALPKLAR